MRGTSRLKSVLVPAPNPHQRIGQGLLENATVAVTCAEAEDETVVVPFGFQRRRRALAGYDPVVMSFLGVIGTQIVFRDVSEDAQRFPGTVLNQFHAGMIFPGAQRIFGFLRSIVVLLIHKRSGISDQTPEPIGPEPAHG